MNEISKTFHFDFNHSVDKLWSIVADTPRWGEASGFPKYQSTEELQPEDTIKVFGEVSIAGFNRNAASDGAVERWQKQRPDYHQNRY
jgi:hypothetical protein